MRWASVGVGSLVVALGCSEPVARNPPPVGMTAGSVSAGAKGSGTSSGASTGDPTPTTTDATGAVACDDAAAIEIVSGRVFFDDAPFSDVAAGTPEISYVEGETDLSQIGSYDPITSRYTTDGVRVDLALSVFATVHTSNDIFWFPGNYHGYARYDPCELLSIDRDAQDIEVARHIHLLLPFDNNAYVPNDLPQAQLSPTTFAWEPVPEATLYTVQVSVGNAAGSSPAYDESTTDTEVTVTLDPLLDPNIYYSFALGAWNENGTRVGHFVAVGMTDTGSVFAGPYRFVVQ